MVESVRVKKFRYVRQLFGASRVEPSIYRSRHLSSGPRAPVFQDTFRTPDYFWFDPYSLEFKGFHLVDGSYQELHPNEQGGLWSEQLKLFLGIQDSQLRFFTPKGQLVPTPEEVAARLAAKLREMDVDPETL